MPTDLAEAQRRLCRLALEELKAALAETTPVVDWPESDDAKYPDRFSGCTFFTAEGGVVLRLSGRAARIAGRALSASLEKSDWEAARAAIAPAGDEDEEGRVVHV